MRASRSRASDAKVVQVDFTSPITIRRATEKDAEGIARCLESAFEPYRSHYTQQAFQDTVPTPAAIQERMRHMTIYAAVSDREEIVGTVATAIHGNEGHLRGMAVQPAWHGLCIAERLLQTAEDELRKAGCLRVNLDTTAPLRRAIRFYQKSGFTPSGRTVDYFGMPLYEFQKSLTA